MSQTQLAKLIGVSKVSVCGYENGKRIPSLNILLKIADVFMISLDELMGRDIKIIAEGEQKYQKTIAEEELLFLNELRKNRLVYNQVIKDPKRSVKYLKHYKTN